MLIGCPVFLWMKAPISSDDQIKIAKHCPHFSIVALHNSATSRKFAQQWKYEWMGG
jgi:hypothetical protein